MTVITNNPVPENRAISWADHNGRSQSWVGDDDNLNSWYVWMGTVSAYEVVRITPDGIKTQFGKSFAGDDHREGCNCTYCGEDRYLVVDCFGTKAEAIAWAEEMIAGKLTDFACKTWKAY